MKNCLIFLFLLAQVAIAQQQLVFKHLSSREGLSQSPVFTMMQDRQGLIWIGNREGLLKYDGYDFKKYSSTYIKRQNAIHNDIRAIYEDANGILWLGTSSGLFLFDPATAKFTVVSTTDQPIVYALLPQKGFLWVATSNGLRRADLRSKQLLPGGINTRVTTLFRDNKGFIWAGTDQGAICLDTAGHRQPVPEVLANLGTIFAINQDHDGDYWFGTEHSGLYWYQAATGSCQHLTHEPDGLLSNFVRDIFIDDQVWIGTRNGLNIFDKQTKHFRQFTHDAADPGSLSHNTVWSFMRDRADNLWLATYAGGINIYHPANTNFTNIGEKIGHRVGLNEPLVNAVLPQGNTLLIGTDGGGLNILDQQRQTMSVFSVKDPASGRLSDIVKALARDSGGHLLAGTLEGLAVIDPGLHTLHYFHFDQDANSVLRINTLLTVPGGVWVGTERNGLKFIRPDGHYDSYLQNKKGISDNYITSLAGDDQTLWIGTRNGLNVYDLHTKKFRVYYPPGSESSSVILSVFTFGKQIWAGTADGLFLFSNQKFYRVGEHELRSQVIQAITADAGGHIWVSTFNGLARIGEDLQITNFTDGPGSSQFSVGAAARQGGQLFFGGVNGVTAFFPERLAPNPYQPRVVIDGLSINNQSVNPVDLKLAYDQNYVTFNFAATSYLNPQNNRYAYQLEGLGSRETWHLAGTQHSVNYTNLSPGHYIFRVKAVGSSFVTSLKLTIAPPWWRTWWAYLFYLLFIFGLIYLVLRFLLTRAKLQRDLYYEHLEHERHQALNQLKLEFFTNVSHELRTPLTLINGPVEQLLRQLSPEDKSYPQLQFIKNNTQRLLRLVTELLDFRKAESGQLKLFAAPQDIVSFLRRIYMSFQYMAEAAGVDYTFSTQQASLEVYFDESQLEKVIYNLLVNAFKVTPPQGRISLLIDLEEMVKISICDSGKGIPPERQAQLFTNFYQVDDLSGRNSGTGIGLALSKSVADLHHGQLSVQSPAGEWSTCFQLSLQLGAAHFRPEQLQAVPVVATTTVPASSIIPAITSGGKGQTVLLVEDNDELRTFLRYALEPHYNIQEAINGLVGWEAAIELIPDIIISDVTMPEMDGLQLTERLKTDERTSHIPVILLTARSSTEHQLSGLGTGVDVYLTKPFDTQLLELQISNLIKAREVWQQKYSRQLLLEPQAPADGPDQRFLTKLLALIEANIENESFGVPAISAEVGMSQPVLYKKVKALTNLSVNDFVKSIRLKRAAQMLSQKQYTVYEVAYAVGFSDSKYFSKEFARQYGLTPSAYKNQAKP